MALEEIYSQFNPSKMRTQLSEFNGGANSYSGYPYQYGHGHGINTPMSTQLVTMKEDYRNASLMSYAEKLDLLMEVQEESGGRPELQDHVFEQCKVVQRRFLAKLQELDGRVSGPVRELVCWDCEVVKRDSEQVRKEKEELGTQLEECKIECGRLMAEFEAIKIDLSKSQDDFRGLKERYEAEGVESSRTICEASTEIRRGRGEIAELCDQLHDTRLDLEQIRRYRTRNLVAAKNYAAAEEAYRLLIELRREIIHSPSVEDDSIDDATILEYRFEETEMQIKQGAPKHLLAESNAHSLYEKRRAGDEDSLETRKSFRQWCATLRCQGDEKVCRAEQMYREIWFFRTGKSDGLWRMENGFELAAVMAQRGEKGDAKSQYRRVWEGRSLAELAGADGKKIREIACEGGHQLGGLLVEEKSWRGAAERLSDVWEARKEALAEYHGDTIATAELLLKAYHNLEESLREDDKEEDLCIWILAAYKKVGKDSASIQGVLLHLATLQLKLAKSEAAAASFKELWEGQKTTIGPTAPATLESCFSYCICLVELEKFAEAAPLIKQNWESRKATLPLKADDIQTLASGHLFGLVLSRLGGPHYAEAEAVLKEIWTSRKRLLAAKEADPDTLATAHSYGYVLLENKEPASPSKIPEARRVLEHTFQLRQQVLGNTHPDTLETGHQYVVARLEQHDLTGLDNIIRGIFETRMKSLPLTDLRVLDSGLVYGMVVLQIAEGISALPHKDAGRRHGIEILRRLWKGRDAVLGVQRSMAANVMLDIGFSLAVALLEVGGAELGEAKAVVEEVVKRLPSDRAARLAVGEVKDPVLVMRDEILRRWDEWEAWRRNPGARARDEREREREMGAKVGNGKGEGGRESSESRGSAGGRSGSSKRGRGDEMKFFRHFARNW